MIEDQTSPWATISLFTPFPVILTPQSSINGKIDFQSESAAVRIVIVHFLARQDQIRKWHYINCWIIFLTVKIYFINNIKLNNL